MNNTNDAMRRELEDLRAHFDQRVAERAELILKAQKIAPHAVLDARLSDDEVRARALACAKGRDAIDGRSTVYIEARFDHLAEQVPMDPVLQAMRSGLRSH